MTASRILLPMHNTLYYGCFLLLLGAVCLPGCAPTVSSEADQVGHHVDFVPLLRCAIMDSMTYESDSSIRAFYRKDLIAIGQQPGWQGKFFVLRDTATKEVTIAIRGTANMANVLSDAQIAKASNNALGIPIHRGFMAAANELYDSVHVHLDDNSEYTINLTGHSLGGAVAAILRLRFEQEKRTLGWTITCGQPKVTTLEGGSKFSTTGIVRMINHRDPIPLVPPNDATEAHGGYVHFGKALLLLDGPYFVGEGEEVAQNAAVNSFWANLSAETPADHKIANYCATLRKKIGYSEEVLFNDRAQYMDTR